MLEPDDVLAGAAAVAGVGDGVESAVFAPSVVDGAGGAPPSEPEADAGLVLVPVDRLSVL